MKKHISTLIFAIFIFISLFSCINNQEKPNYLITKNVILSNPKEIKASDFLGNNIRYIRLEAKGADMIGRVNKIVKKNKQFFILCDDKRIIHFDNNGSYISSLNKPGKGPEEYNRINDFDISKINGTYQLWLADFASIKIYTFNKEWTLENKINFPFVIHKFKRLSNDLILFMAGQNEKSLCITDLTGKVLKEFLDKQIPFLTFKSVQFIKTDSVIIFPLGVANEFISCNLQTGKFKHNYYVQSDELITKTELLELFDEKGFAFYADLKNKSYINNLRYLKNKTIIQYNLKGERYISSINSEGTVLNGRFHPNPTIIDDITPIGNINFFSSFLYGASDESILFLQEPENPDDGMAIIEVFE